MAGLNMTAGQLNSAWKTLCQRWEESKMTWNDPVRWDFEKTYWMPLGQQVRATQREMERLMQVISQARRSIK